MTRLMLMLAEIDIDTWLMLILVALLSTRRGSADFIATGTIA